MKLVNYNKIHVIMRSSDRDNTSNISILDECTVSFCAQCVIKKTGSVKIWKADTNLNSANVADAACSGGVEVTSGITMYSPGGTCSWYKNNDSCVWTFNATDGSITDEQVCEKNQNQK